MSTPLDLVREDLRGFAGYRSARSDALQGDTWLNANEFPWPNAADDGSARRYPDPQPAGLRRLLADLYDCAPSQLLVGRGSDEAIDLLVRALCRPGGDAVLVTPPTFGMYAVSARLHGTRVVDVPLQDGEDGLRCDFAAVTAAALREDVRIAFLCSPGNPGGALLPVDDVAALATALEGRALVVVDEAYIEFADGPSAVGWIGVHRNLAVLRTLSKAHALAGARVGCVIGDAVLVEVLRRCQAPYPLSAPAVALATAALQPAARAATRAGVAGVLRERAVLEDALRRQPDVRRVYPSQANFVLARFARPQAVFDRLLAAGIVVRDMRAVPGLDDALRIGVGTPEQTARVVDCLREGAPA